MKAAAIIPARFESSRFPGKPLARIGGKPMLRHVYENVSSTGLFSLICIATDDETIKTEAESWGAKVYLTSKEHPSGTDRCAEVIRKFDVTFDIVVNVQGDEPFLSFGALKTLVELFNDPSKKICTLVKRITDRHEIENSNVVKVVLDKYQRALYFSRSVIPFRKGDQNSHYLKHVGVYAFNPRVLQEIVNLKPSMLEETEKLEQLRWLENGYEIYAGFTDYESISVDTPEDLERAEKHYQIMKSRNSGL